MKRFYSLLLHLFPKVYREEYGDELQTVFNLSLDDAMRSGRMEVVRITLRELTGLPKAILREHLRERTRKKMIRKFIAFFDFTHGSRREYFTALIPFLFVGIIHPMMNVLTRSGLLIPRGQFVNGIGIILIAVLGVLFLLGLVTGLPRWAMPYLGFTSAVFGLIASPDVLRLVKREFPLLYQDKPWGDLFYSNAWSLGLLIVLILFMVLAGSVSAFRRFRVDWTLLCFIPYGAVPLALMLTFEEYKKQEPFMFLAFLVLASGAWLYLRGGEEWKRFAALFGGLTLAMLIAAVGKAILLPVQDWPIVLHADSWKSEAMGTVNAWMWLASSMLIPLALNLLPKAKSHFQTSDIAVM